MYNNERKIRMAGRAVFGETSMRKMSVIIAAKGRPMRKGSPILMGADKARRGSLGGRTTRLTIGDRKGGGIWTR